MGLNCIEVVTRFASNREYYLYAGKNVQVVSALMISSLYSIFTTTHMFHLFGKEKYGSNNIEIYKIKIIIEKVKIAML